MEKRFWKDARFPNEAFVQQSIEAFFESRDFSLTRDGQVDLLAEKDGETWVVEAKGLTGAVGTDFNTCLGQLVKWMDGPGAVYAIAVPRHARYQTQCARLSGYVRGLLNLHILLVGPAGDVTVVTPRQDPAAFFGA